jgi:CRP-like cAMP-binding protein
MPTTPSLSTSNRILTRLPRDDFALLVPHLEHVDLPVKASLETRNKRITHVYFIEAGFASVVANGSDKRGIEVGIIGREGMTGLAVVLGHDRADHAVYMQAAGEALRITAANLRQVDGESPVLHRAMLRYIHAFMRQTAANALANGRSKIEERLARWVLMAADRLDADELPLTHEFLALMLGAHRPGVTKAVQALEKVGLIATRRSKITIVDRGSLMQLSNGTYVPPAK